MSKAALAKTFKLAVCQVDALYLTSITTHFIGESNAKQIQKP